MRLRRGVNHVVGRRVRSVLLRYMMIPVWMEVVEDHIRNRVQQAARVHLRREVDRNEIEIESEQARDQGTTPPTQTGQ